jgi:hypothetical protein
MLLEIAACPGTFEAESSKWAMKGTCKRVKKENKILVFIMSAGSRHILAKKFVRGNMP